MGGSRPTIIGGASMCTYICWTIFFFVRTQQHTRRAVQHQAWDRACPRMTVAEKRRVPFPILLDFDNSHILFLFLLFIYLFVSCNTEKKLRHRAEVVREIAATEESYVETLRVCVDVFMLPLEEVLATRTHPSRTWSSLVLTLQHNRR